VKLSNRCQYGVRALFDVAFYGRGRSVRLQEIAARQGIPRPFLEQIFFTLKKAGLVTSTRGPKGGYRLARPASGVSLGEIIRALEGPVQPVPCETMEEDGSPCDYLERCVTREVWREAGRILSGYFDSVTLEELCRRGEAMGLGCTGELVKR